MRTTKTMILTAIADIVNGLTEEEITETGGTVTKEDILNYCADTRDQIEAKAVKEQERKEARKADSAGLVEAIYGVLGSTPMTRGEILKALPANEDLTEAKIGARLNQLVADGRVIKEDMKVDGRKLKGYRK